MKFQFLTAICIAIIALIAPPALAVDKPHNLPPEHIEKHKKHFKKHTHQHDIKCGHKSESHGTHTDYEHDGHHHHKHSGHFDECEGPEGSAAKATTPTEKAPAIQAE